MNKEFVVIYTTVEYYSAIKRDAFESVLMRWVNLETIIHTSESERERERSYSNAHIQSLEKWF